MKLALVRVVHVYILTSTQHLPCLTNKRSIEFATRIGYT